MLPYLFHYVFALFAGVVLGSILHELTAHRSFREWYVAFYRNLLRWKN